MSKADIIFPATIQNNPLLKGQPAAPKQFWDDHRFAVAPVHTRFDRVAWFVWDAEAEASDLSHAEVIRIEDTLEAALAGLPDDFIYEDA